MSKTIFAKDKLISYEEGVGLKVSDLEETTPTSDNIVLLHSNGHPRKASISSLPISGPQQAALDAVSDKDHTHDFSEITDFPTSLPSNDVPSWAKASAKPTLTASELGYATSDHTHDSSYLVTFAGSAQSGALLFPGGTLIRWWTRSISGTSQISASMPSLTVKGQSAIFQSGFRIQISSDARLDHMCYSSGNSGYYARQSSKGTNTFWFVAIGKWYYA